MRSSNVGGVVGGQEENRVSHFPLLTDSLYSSFLSDLGNGPFTPHVVKIGNHHMRALFCKQ